MAQPQLSVTVEVDDRKLREILRELGLNTNEYVLKLAEDTSADIKRSFGTSPAPPNNPPGVDTGKLKNSITAEPDGAGRAVTWTDTEYAPYLELGTYRGGGFWVWPFFLPAVERTRRTMHKGADKVVIGG